MLQLHSSALVFMLGLTYQIDQGSLVLISLEYDMVSFVSDTSYFEYLHLLKANITKWWEIIT